MSAHSHYIIRCSSCDTVIEQCRCMSQTKIVKYKLCDQCKQKPKCEYGCEGDPR